jgi:hypothetical protein
VLKVYEGALVKRTQPRPAKEWLVNCDVKETRLGAKRVILKPIKIVAEVHRNQTNRSTHNLLQY